MGRLLAWSGWLCLVFFFSKRGGGLQIPVLGTFSLYKLGGDVMLDVGVVFGWNDRLYDRRLFGFQGSMLAGMYGVGEGVSEIEWGSESGD